MCTGLAFSGGGGGGGVATLSDIRTPRPEKDDEETEKFYAGGSEHRCVGNALSETRPCCCLP